MMSAKGSFDFLRSEFVVGIAFSVDLTYLGGQLASGEGVTLDCCESISNRDPSIESQPTYIWGENEGWRRQVKV